MDALNQSLNTLYTVFSSYNMDGNIKDRACECCVTNEEIQSLLSKPLRELNDDDIRPFSQSAITTFGDINDYKHFLPRILELLQKPNSNALDDFTTFEKLNYSQWQTWDKNEVFAIQNYFKTLLLDALAKNSDTIYDYIYLNLQYNDFGEVSKILLSSNSKRFLEGIVESVLASYIYPFEKKLQNLYADKRILNKIETLFFEEKDNVKASRISIAYSLLENQISQ